MAPREAGERLPVMKGDPPSASPAGNVRWMVRVVGLGMVVASIAPFWESLKALDHQDWVSSLLAGVVGWFICQAGIELVRPESAE